MAADPFRGSIYIDAPREVVFDYFTKADSLVQWMGDRAIVDPRPGGKFTLFFEDRAVEGTYLDLDFPRRLVISWGRGGSSSFPPASSTLEVLLTSEGAGTRVDITHSGLPSSEVDRHALGWRHYLERLAMVGAATLPSDAWAQITRRCK